MAEEGYRATTSAHALLALGDAPVNISEYPGRLITLEGTDGVGRSTHIGLLQEWLESNGFAVVRSGLTESHLAGQGLRDAKDVNTLGRLTADLYYATDFADRLERDILPALRAGFVVLTDRYVYSTMARSIVRGANRDWINNVYRFAPTPHAVFYLRVDVEHLVPRVLSNTGFNYWESGYDFQAETDLYQSFVRYQNHLLEVFDDLSNQYNFAVIDANRPIKPVFESLRDGVRAVVDQMRSSAS
ncbi:MAG: thymidylate kinase [Phycisphaeraceae bacterium]|nr:thymidylate kinase [Phycisphaeraceae bacterium]MCB9847739.1 thymidylate kinase [Phycisphaeraceae bacterium]